MYHIWCNSKSSGKHYQTLWYQFMNNQNTVYSLCNEAHWDPFFGVINIFLRFLQDIWDCLQEVEVAWTLFDEVVVSNLFFPLTRRGLSKCSTVSLTSCVCVCVSINSYKCLLNEQDVFCWHVSRCHRFNSLWALSSPSRLLSTHTSAQTKLTQTNAHTTLTHTQQAYVPLKTHIHTQISQDYCQGG